MSVNKLLVPIDCLQDITDFFLVFVFLQVPIPNHEIFLCFGAVVPDGYGVCYNPQESQFILSVSSFHSNPKTNSHVFLKKLTETFGEMREVLVAANGLNAKL